MQEPVGAKHNYRRIGARKPIVHDLLQVIAKLPKDGVKCHRTPQRPKSLTQARDGTPTPRPSDSNTRRWLLSTNDMSACQHDGTHDNHECTMLPALNEVCIYHDLIPLSLSLSGRHCLSVYLYSADCPTGLCPKSAMPRPDAPTARGDPCSNVEEIAEDAHRLPNAPTPLVDCGWS